MMLASDNSICSASAGRRWRSMAAWIVVTSRGSRSWRPDRLVDAKKTLLVALAPAGQRRQASSSIQRLDLVDDARFLGDRSELLAADRAELRVVPAHQAFDAGQFERVDRHARLVDELQLAAFHGAAQRRLDQQPPAQLRLRQRRERTCSCAGRRRDRPPSAR